MNKRIIAIVDNNIIDRLLLLNNDIVSKLNNNIIFETHSDIFEETKACNNIERRERLLQMYPKFGIKTFNDNSFPIQFPFTFYSDEAWNMCKVFMSDKNNTTNNYNDSLLILMQYDNQISNKEAILISDNKKDFQNFCKNNKLNWYNWSSFENKLKDL